jgi:hypothetical protein
MSFFRTSTFSAVAATAALVISIGSATFITLDAFNTRDTVLAQALQSVGLCNPIDQVVNVTPSATSTPTSEPSASTTATPESSESEASSTEPAASASPAESAAAGQDGADGQTGATGNSGKTGAAGTNGISGANGSPGEKGEKGDTGSTGSSGADGATGPAGPAGPAGSAGATGSTGATGATGANGICDISQILPVNGDLNPSRDNVYSLGSLTNRWKSLQLGPGTLWIQDSEVTPPTQVGLTVKSGALLLDGADSLRIGNIRLTATGLTSIVPTSPITLGDATFTNYVELQAGGIKFKDGTIQSTASTGGATGPQGPAGPQGPKGDTGAQGPQGEPGTVDGFIEVPVCINKDNNGVAHMAMFYGTCDELKIKGTDIVMLQRKG